MKDDARNQFSESNKREFEEKEIRKLRRREEEVEESRKRKSVSFEDEVVEQQGAGLVSGDQGSASNKGRWRDPRNWILGSVERTKVTCR